MNSAGKQPARSIARTIFYGIGLFALAFLTYRTVTFVQEARVAVNIGTDSTDTPRQRIVNKSAFVQPDDGLLRLDQIDMMLHIIESSDSSSASSEGARINRIVELLNEYTTSLDEYRWIRTSIARDLMKAPQRNALRSLGRYETLLVKDFQRHRRYFTDSLDKALL